MTKRNQNKRHKPETVRLAHRIVEWLRLEGPKYGAGFVQGVWVNDYRTELRIGAPHPGDERIFEFELCRAIEEELEKP